MEVRNIVLKYLKHEKDDSGLKRGYFIINGLRVNEGSTIGTQFRRVLLNDLVGNSITGVRFKGVENIHQYSVISAREDVLEILLNTQGVILKGNIKSNLVGTLKMEGPGVVTASCIKFPKNLKIINPNHYLMSIPESASVDLEFLIERRTGYRLASQTFSKTVKDKGKEYVAADATFMPVHRVTFHTRNYHDDKNNILEELRLDITTDGSISPAEAFIAGARLTINLYSTFNLNRKNLINAECQTLEKDFYIPPYSEIGIEILELPPKIRNCLKKSGIHRIDSLIESSEKDLLNIKNFGQKSLDIVLDELYNKFKITLD
uniref:DNA-directed RNA polymerase n=1 Tax=Nitzschia sp. PL1-4 TaxID=2083272 RepID=A0A2Z5ZB37_9STRA|nr:RNA polymerase alpha subunit [Nitzschia sp. PL1-4]